MPRYSRLTDFTLNYAKLGPSAAYAATAEGQAIVEVLLSHDAVVALIAAIETAPTRPPYPCLDRYLLAAVGMACSSDPAKVLVGRVTRQVVEHLGGAWVRSGVPITEASVFANGSIYRLPTTARGKMNAADRRAWAESRLVQLQAGEV